MIDPQFAELKSIRESAPAEDSGAPLILNMHLLAWVFAISFQMKTWSKKVYTAVLIGSLRPWFVPSLVLLLEVGFIYLYQRL